MELTLKQVQESLARLVFHYPEAGHNGGTLNGVARDYFEDLTEDRTSAEEFTEVVKLARRRCKFFPKIADIIELRNELWANPIRKPVAGLIAEESLVKTPEMIEEGRFNCKVVKVMLDRGISDTEARKVVAVMAEKGVSAEEAMEIISEEEKSRPQLQVVGQ